MVEFERLLKLDFHHLANLKNYKEERDRKAFDSLEEFLVDRLKDKVPHQVMFFFILPDEKTKGIVNLYLGYDREYVADPQKMVNVVTGLMKKLEIL